MDSERRSFSGGDHGGSYPQLGIPTIIPDRLSARILQEARGGSMGDRQAGGRKGELDVRHAKDFSPAYSEGLPYFHNGSNVTLNKSFDTLPPRLNESTTYRPDNTPLGA